MCLAVPLEIEQIQGDFAIARAGNIRRKINIAMLTNPKVGDYCLVHAGFAIRKIDTKAAEETKELLSQIKNVKILKK